MPSDTQKDCFLKAVEARKHAIYRVAMTMLRHQADAEDAVFPSADKDGISWRILAGCQVDDEEVSAVGITCSIAGTLNGQVLTISQFDLSSVPVKNPFSVLLPIAGQNTPKSLRFGLPSSPLSGVKQLP